MLNKNLLDEEVNEQMACVFMNILCINPLRVRKWFHLEKKLFIRGPLKPAKNRDNDSRSSLQSVLQGSQMVWNSKRGLKPEAPRVWLFVTSLWRLTCGGLCSEHKSLVCPGSLGLAVASVEARPHAQPRLWGRSGACKEERANSPEENREVESQRKKHVEYHE